MPLCIGLRVGISVAKATIDRHFSEYAVVKLSSWREDVSRIELSIEYSRFSWVIGPSLHGNGLKFLNRGSRCGSNSRRQEALPYKQGKCRITRGKSLEEICLSKFITL